MSSSGNESAARTGAHAIVTNAVSTSDSSGESAPRTGAQAVVADAVNHQNAVAQTAAAAAAIDPARRPDVLFRVRRKEGEQVSPWWLVGAFVGVSAVVILLFSFVPGGA